MMPYYFVFDVDFPEPYVIYKLYKDEPIAAFSDMATAEAVLLDLNNHA